MKTANSCSDVTTIYEQLIHAFKDVDDRLLTMGEIKSVFHERFGTNTSSIIPSDYCYNRWNQGLQQDRPLFVRVAAGEYRFLGATAPFTGLVFCRPRGTTVDRVAGERIDGVLRLYESTCVPAGAAPVESTESRENCEVVPLSRQQLDRLYERYLEILALEVGEFGCRPTETRHLIGRLGEFYCARKTGGQLARRVNQEGFDVIGAHGRRISVKTTAQRIGFVSINARTSRLVDDLMVLRYGDEGFELIYYGDVQNAIRVARPWQDRFELDLAKARALQAE